MKRLKKNLLLYLLLVITTSYAQKKIKLEYQNDNLIKQIGIGLVQQVKPNESVLFYKDRECSQIKIRDVNYGRYVIPFLYKVDYGILFFVCVERNDKYYKIAINKDDYAYIKPTVKLLFYDWEDFLKNQVTSIESKDLKANPFFDKINGKPIFLKNYQTDDESEVLEVHNDWLKIKNNTINRTYWLQWRENNNFLIYLNLLM